MTDVEAFVRARLDEDQKLAESATEGPWSVDRDGEVYQTNSLREVPCIRLDGSKYTSTDQVNVTCDSEGIRASVQRENADHIARHNPKAILADIALKRDILDLWIEAGKSKDFTAQTWVLLREIVYAIAALYSDHPDHDPKWKPIFGGTDA